MLRFRVPPALRRARARRGSSEARGRARASRSQQIKARIAERRGAEHASLFDAQLLMLDDPMLVGRAAAIVRERAAQRRVGAAAGARRDLGASSTRSQDPLPARAQGRRRRRGRPAEHEPARRPATRRSVHGARGAAGAGRRRADAVGRSRSSTGRRLAASPPTPAAGPITPRSWRARSTCRRSSGCTTPAR